MKLSLLNSNTFYHLGLGLGICGISLFLSYAPEDIKVNINKSNHSTDNLS